jgi:serine/threonine-protein kinase PknK
MWVAPYVHLLRAWSPFHPSSYGNLVVTVLPSSKQRAPDGGSPDRYQLGERIGSGAQGTVFRATDRLHPERALVAKVMIGADPETRTALRQEFALLARTVIDGLVTVRDLVATPDRVALIEDYIEGVSVTEYLGARDESSEPTKARGARFTSVFQRALSALAALHEHGFVHGDVKPAHLRVDAQGKLTLLDLGGAALRAQRLNVFTPAFAAPEVCAGGVATERSDLFSLARSMVVAVTGALEHTSLRRAAPWLLPREQEIIEHCLREHPADRPIDASACLARLGAVQRSHARPLLGRASEVQACLAVRAHAIYLVGEPGMGKSRVLREAFSQHIANGGDAHFVHGNEHAELARHTPQMHAGTQGTLFIDDVELAGEDFRIALELHRILKASAFRVVVSARSAPLGSTIVHLHELPDAVLQQFAEGAGAALAVAHGNPGLLLAALGLGSASTDALNARVRSLSSGAQRALAVLALAEGSLPLAFPMLDPRSASELACEGFARRERGELRLSAPQLARSIAETLGSETLAEELAKNLLTYPGEVSSAAFAVAKGTYLVEQQGALLAYVCHHARALERRRDEHDALGLLLEIVKERTTDRLLRYERVSRELGRPLPDRVIAWLCDGAVGERQTLATRRSLEALARAGNHAQAATGFATLLAEHPTDPLVRSTEAVLALFRGDAKSASAALVQIPSDFSTDDQEELARIAHNRGVTHIYRGQFAEAAREMQASVERKRRLGDAAGVRSSLLNLGIAYGKLESYPQAVETLEQSIALARSLHNAAGVVWGLAALAEFLLRSGDLDAAMHAVTEANRAPNVPALIAKDLAFVECEVLLRRGKSAEAKLVCERYLDTSHDGPSRARAHVLLGTALSQIVPVQLDAAVRAVVAGARIARASGSSEFQKRARAALRSFRQSAKGTIMKDPLPLYELASAHDRLSTLLRYIAKQSEAQRVYAAQLAADTSIASCAGVDREGYAVTEASPRMPRSGLEAALSTEDAAYQRALAMDDAEGSVLTIAAPESGRGVRAVLVLEHRYKKGAFDSLEQAWLRSVVALLQIVLPAPGVRPAEARAPQPTPDSTGGPSHISMADATLGPVGDRRAFPTLIGTSRTLEATLTALDRAVDSTLPVLLLGETGVGKELFARALHDEGPRSKAPFVALNCAAIADGVFESELFGHRKGAFTGADRDRPGALGQAQGGTLFLDEIGELPIARQSALLRALESKTYRTVGHDREQPFDVRIVSATNRNLEAEAARGTFRSDLLFRLNVVELKIPPLRDRLEDVPALVEHFNRSKTLGLQFDGDALDALCTYTYPGNIRELLHLLERLSLLRTRIRLEHLPRSMRQTRAGKRATVASPEDRQRQEVERALLRSEGNITHAAEALGLTRHGLKKRMLRLGLRGQS